MTDDDKTKQALISELKTLRQRLAEQDISELRQIDGTFEQSEAKFHDMIMHLMEGFYSVTIDGDLLEYNQELCRILGLDTDKDYVGLRLPDFWQDPQDRQEYLEAFQATGKIRNYLAKAKKVGGEKITVQINARLIKDENGQPVRVEGTVLDITEQHTAERQARLEKEFADKLINSLPGVFYMFGTDGRMLRWNRNFEILSGYSSEEMGKMLAIDLIAEEFKEATSNAIQEVFTAGESSIETSLVTKQGEALPYFCTGARVQINNDIYLIGMGIDITQRKKIEDELTIHRDDLEELVEERTRELQERVNEVELLNRGMTNLAEDMQGVNKNLERTTERLTETNQELESFSYSVSHDLRAPLRAIGGFSKILAEDHSKDLDEEGRRVLGIVTANAEKMGTLIDDILAFSRMGRKAMNPQPVDLASLVEEIREEIMTETNGRVIDWQIKNLPNVLADPALIRQVLTNLQRNAVKFTATRETAMIEIGSRQENGEVIIHVKDNGVGFDMQYVDKIFEIFQRLHRDEDFKGTGIGLAIVRRIVQRHGGRVWAESVIENGTTINFSLPETGEQQ